MMNYRCQVACKLTGQKQVDIFSIDHDFNYEKESKQYKYKRRTMTFFNDEQQNLQIRISHNFQKVILVNTTENYILEDDQKYI